MKQCTGIAEPFFSFFLFFKVSHYCAAISNVALPKCYIGFLSNINLWFSVCLIFMFNSHTACLSLKMLCQVHIVKYKKLCNHTQLEVKDRETKMAAICQNVFCFKGFFSVRNYYFFSSTTSCLLQHNKKKKICHLNLPQVCSQQIQSCAKNARLWESFNRPPNWFHAWEKN